MDGKRLAVVWFFIQALFFSVFSQAEEKQLLLNDLFENARLERQLQWIQSSMTLPSGEYALPKDVVNTVNQVVLVRYTPDYFRTAMTATLDEALTEKELLELLKWYSSSLGQKILELEAHANDPSNAEEMQAYINRILAQQIPRTERIGLIESLMEVLDTVELSTELAASASVGAQRLLREVMPAADGKPMLPPNTLKAKEKPGIRKDMAKKMRAIFLYTYRTLPDHEIRTYLEFASQNAMQNFQRGQILAMARML